MAITPSRQRNAVSEGMALGLIMCDRFTLPWDKVAIDLSFEFPPFRRSGGYLLPVGAGVRLSGSVWVCQAASYSSGLR